jgi:hypothetical protein
MRRVHAQVQRTKEMLGDASAPLALPHRYASALSRPALALPRSAASNRQATEQPAELTVVRYG